MMPSFPSSIICEEANFWHSIICVLLLSPIEGADVSSWCFVDRSKRDGTLELVFTLTDPMYVLLGKGLSVILKQEESHLILSIFPREITVMVILAKINFKAPLTF